MSSIVCPLITRPDFETQSLGVRIGQAIVLARRLHPVGIATNIQDVVRRGREVRDCAGRIQFQASSAECLFDVDKGIPLPRTRWRGYTAYSQALSVTNRFPCSGI